MSDLFSAVGITRADWDKVYIHPGSLIQDPSLVVKEEAPDIFSFPLFTKLFCSRLIEHAEEHAVWALTRHKNYPTTDCLLNSIDVEPYYKHALITYVVPVLRYVWRYTWDANELCGENFLAKYNPEAQNSLATHNDDSWFSMVVALNDDFEGGGTSFPRQKIQIKNPIGYAMIHPGRLTHPHGGLPTTDGTRYITVSFMTPYNESTGPNNE